MIKTGNIILFLLATLGLVALKMDAPKIKKGKPVYPKYWPKPEYNFRKNPLDEKKIELGRTLFYDPILSLDSSTSCASCHQSYTAFTHVDHMLSHGIGDSIGERNSLSLVNLAWTKDFMWDGAIVDLDRQALAPITHPDEMGESIENVLVKLNRRPEYRESFLAAYGSEKISVKNMLDALTQFQLTMISAGSKYDQVQAGKAEYTAQEANGEKLFSQHCASCHVPPLFTNHEFIDNGLSVAPNLMDMGRYRVTQRSSDSLKFKVPTLRNIYYSRPYMHDGRFRTLFQVLDFYGSEKEARTNLHPAVKEPIRLTLTKKMELIAFLRTLDDRAFMRNPAFDHPRRARLGQ